MATNNIKTQAQREIAKRKALEAQALKEKKQKAKQKKIIAIAAVALVAVVLAIVLPIVLIADDKYTPITISQGLLNASKTDVSDTISQLNDQKVQVTGYAATCTSSVFYLSSSSVISCPFGTSKYSDNTIAILYRNKTSIGTKFANKKVTVKGTLHIGDTVIAEASNGSKETAYVVLYIDDIELAS